MYLKRCSRATGALTNNSRNSEPIRTKFYTVLGAQRLWRLWATTVKVSKMAQKKFCQGDKVFQMPFPSDPFA